MIQENSIKNIKLEQDAFVGSGLRRRLSTKTVGGAIRMDNPIPIEGELEKILLKIKRK